MFKLTQSDVVIRLKDKAQIPNDKNNLDRQEYDEFLKQGGVPEAADPVPVPPDLSDSANQDRAIKAVLMVIADVNGLTNNQVKALFKAKWGLLG